MGPSIMSIVLSDRDNKGGYDYRFTTNRDYDYAVQDGHFGVQMHHLWFLECVGAP